MANAGGCRVRVRGERSRQERCQRIDRDVRLGLELATGSCGGGPGRGRELGGLGRRGHLARRPLRRVLHRFTPRASGRRRAGRDVPARPPPWAPYESRARAPRAASTSPFSSSRRARHVLHWCDDCLRVFDRRTRQLANASPTADGRPPDRTITEAGISADGRTVVFSTEAYNMGVDDGLGDHAFAWHRQQGSTTVIATAASCVWSADVSANGRTALFTPPCGDSCHATSATYDRATRSSPSRYGERTVARRPDPRRRQRRRRRPSSIHP
jgi:hypothetical protein